MEAVQSKDPLYLESRGLETLEVVSACLDASTYRQLLSARWLHVLRLGQNIHSQRLWACGDHWHRILFCSNLSFQRRAFCRRLAAEYCFERAYRAQHQESRSVHGDLDQAKAAGMAACQCPGKVEDQ